MIRLVSSRKSCLFAVLIFLGGSVVSLLFGVLDEMVALQVKTFLSRNESGAVGIFDLLVLSFWK